MSNSNKKLVKLLLLCNGPKEEVVESDNYGGHYHITDFDAEFWADKVIVYGDLFKLLEGKTRDVASDGKKRLSVIKITTKDGKSIHRAFYGRKGVKGFDKNAIALTSQSIRMLNKDGNPEHIDEVYVSKGCKFDYYWNHPFHATRIAVKLGLVSLVSGFLSLIITILSIIFSLCK